VDVVGFHDDFNGMPLTQDEENYISILKDTHHLILKEGRRYVFSPRAKNLFSSRIKSDYLFF
jgi:hypothetical protein